MNKLPASTGLEWLKQGFALFRRNSGVLITLTFAQLLAGIVLASIPPLGIVGGIVLMPSFLIAILQACHLSDEGKPVTLGILATGFRKGVIGPMCKLGGVYLGLIILVMLAVVPFIDQAALQETMKTMAEHKAVPAGTAPPPPVRMPLQVTLMLALIAIIMLLLWFAPALAYWKRMPTFKAIFYSFFGVVGALLPILTMMLAGAGLGIAASTITGLVFGQTQFGVVIVLWLSVLLHLVMQCALFSAYKQIFGVPESEPPLK